MLLPVGVGANALCPKSATAIHSVVVDRTLNLRIGRRALYHWANGKQQAARHSKHETKVTAKKGKELIAFITRLTDGWRRPWWSPWPWWEGTGPRSIRPHTCTSPPVPRPDWRTWRKSNGRSEKRYVIANVINVVTDPALEICVGAGRTSAPGGE